MASWRVSTGRGDEYDHGARETLYLFLTTTAVQYYFCVTSTLNVVQQDKLYQDIRAFSYEIMQSDTFIVNTLTYIRFKLQTSPDAKSDHPNARI